MITVHRLMPWIISVIALTSCGPTIQTESSFQASTLLLETNRWTISAPDIIPNPAWAGLLENGQLVLIDRSLNTVNLFDPDGKLISTFGGVGRGPSEFSDITHAAVHSDGRVAIVDQRSAQIIIVDVHTHSMSYLDLKLGWNTKLAWVNNDLLLSNSPFDHSMSKSGDILIRSYDLNSKQDRIVLHLELELSNPPFEQVSCTFCEFRYTSDMDIYTSPQDTSYRIFRMDPTSGESVLFTRSGIPAVAFSEQERNDRAAQLATTLGTPRTSQKGPTHKRRFFDYFVDHKNRLWALLNRLEGDAIVADVFSPNGHYEGSLTLPDEVQSLLFASGNRVILQLKSDDPDIWIGSSYKIFD